MASIFLFASKQMVFEEKKLNRTLKSLIEFNGTEAPIIRTPFYIPILRKFLGELLSYLNTPCMLLHVTIQEAFLQCLGAIVSTLHKYMKFLTEHTVRKIYNNYKTTKIVT